MNAPRAAPEDYVQYLIASPRVVSAVEAGRVQPIRPNAPGHDAFTRLLTRIEPDTAALWDEVRPHASRPGGVLVLDDSTLDKPYAREIALVGHHWSGKHKDVVRGINLLTMLWTDGDALWPCDYRLLEPKPKPKPEKAEDPATAGPPAPVPEPVPEPAPRLTKNDHFRDMLAAAKARGQEPRLVLFDSWYSSMENLKAVRGHGWHFLTRVKSNRRVDPDRTGNRAISEVNISAEGTWVHLEGFGMVKAFRIASTNGDAEHWITDDLGMDDAGRLAGSELAWGIEDYHRGLKQFTGVERCQARLEKSQRNHVGFAIRAFVRLEWLRFSTGLGWFEAKWQVVREAVRAYLANPLFTLPNRATA